MIRYAMPPIRERIRKRIGEVQEQIAVIKASADPLEDYYSDYRSARLRERQINEHEATIEALNWVIYAALPSEADD